MNIRLHQRARTTPAVRQEIQASSLSERRLARKYGITRATVRKWKGGRNVQLPRQIHFALGFGKQGVVKRHLASHDELQRNRSSSGGSVAPAVKSRGKPAG
ncbi:hypothetical protein [Methylococcus capsulatus]|jgi:hypothetical protein|uniref:hypothetical protein n=1 Tax=Methylococcus capsulatus TaxID=414 RepID=UPI001C528A24|nr:hypothetical protein KW114_11055 [Methylococcus capsulatus]